VPELLRVRNELAGDSGRALVLRPEAGGTLTYAVVRGDSTGPTLDEADLRFDSALQEQVDGAVADLAGGGGESAMAALARVGVQYVLVQTPDADAQARAEATELRATLSNAGGLVADTSSPSTTVWKLTQETYEVALVDPAHEARTDMERLDGDVGAPTGAFNVPYSPYVRVVVLAEAPSGRWHAALDGAPLQSTTYLGGQAFEVPVGAGRLTIGHDAAGRGVALAVEAVLVVVAIILTFPGTRRSAEPLPAPGARTSRHGKRSGS
jgi:hypothetical protein